MDQLQIKKIEFTTWESNKATNSFSLKDKQLVFFNYHILLLDQSFNYKKIIGRPKFDMIWLHQNPKKKITTLGEEVIFSTLLIDATNQDYKIRLFETEANKFKLSSYTLKKNRAYLLNLKP